MVASTIKAASWLLLLAGALPAFAADDNNSDLKISPDGSCGGDTGYTCWLSFFGNCCGKDGQCGATSDQCGSGCQKDYGYCSGVEVNIDVIAAPDDATATVVNNTKRAEAIEAREVLDLAQRDAEEYEDLQDLAKRATATCQAADTLNKCLNPAGTAKASSSARASGTAYCKKYLGTATSVVYITTTKSYTSTTRVRATTTDQVTVFNKRATTTAAASSVSGQPACVTSNGGKTTSYTPARITSACSCLGYKQPTKTYTKTSTIYYKTTTTITTATTTAHATTTTCKSKPTSTPSCVPCQGQSGSAPLCGADISTNMYDFTPKTCQTVTYNLDISEISTLGLDGVSRTVMAINGQYPGPLIEANWGDTLVITVNNKLTENGTTIHWHGIRQNFTNQNDGVPAITQCPIAPGESMTYTWVASNYGTSWYHSHFALQAYNGIAGPMLIHGPDTAPTTYTDAGFLTVTDWSHQGVFAMYDAAQTQGPRTMDNGLINGMNIWLGDDQNSTAVGERYTVNTTFEAGKTYRFHLLNTAIQSTFKFYIDGHNLTVISADFVPIVPYETNIVNINIGQRYEVLVTANAAPGDYFARFDNQNACAATTQALDIRAIIHYDGHSGTPTSTAYTYTGECVDEPVASLVPYQAIDAGSDDVEDVEDITVSQNSAGLFKWYLSGTTFQSEWGQPTLLQIWQNGTTPDFSGDLLINVPDVGKWVYLVVESGIPLPHPIHLHGHDFHIVAEGTGSYDSSTTPLNLSNPPRRDTALLPGAGFLVIAFITDNPGAWLMHCHIGWHASMGLALQVVEMQSQINGTVDDSCTLDGVCSKYNAYATANSIVTDDSGI